MITLYGNYLTIEALTMDLRRALLAIGVMVVREITCGEGDDLWRYLWVEELWVREFPLINTSA